MKTTITTLLLCLMSIMAWGSNAELEGHPNISPRNFGGYMIGRIGGDDGAVLNLSENGVGTYEFNGYTRTVKWGSYNKATGTLILKAYDSRGRYIGHFEGRVTQSSYRLTHPEKMTIVLDKYKGTFTNTKGGKVTFELEDYCDLPEEYY